jgi:hypothetical protein
MRLTRRTWQILTAMGCKKNKGVNSIACNQSVKNEAIFSEVL